MDAGLRRLKICLKIFCTEVTTDAVGVRISARLSTENRAKVITIKESVFRGQLEEKNLKKNI